MKNQNMGRPIALSIILIVLLCVISLPSDLKIMNVYGEGIPKVPAFAELPGYEDRQPLYQELKDINDHVVGWIYIEGTEVDYILMQNIEDKDYYIDKDFNGNYYYPGTLYISNISDLIKPTDVVIMYGHNMKNRTMFGSLRDYEDPEFLKKHDVITVDNMEGRLEYEITHVMRIRVNVEVGDDFPYYTFSDFESEAEYDAFIEQCNSHVLYDSGKSTEFGDRLVMLTTCEYTYADGTGRLVIMGKNPAPPEPEPEPTEEAIEIPIEEPPASGIDMQDILLIGGIVVLVALALFLLLKLRKSRK